MAAPGRPQGSPLRGRNQKLLGLPGPYLAHPSILRPLFAPAWGPRAMSGWPRSRLPLGLQAGSHRALDRAVNEPSAREQPFVGVVAHRAVLEDSEVPVVNLAPERQARDLADGAEGLHLAPGRGAGWRPVPLPQCPHQAPPVTEFVRADRRSLPAISRSALRTTPSGCRAVGWHRLRRRERPRPRASVGPRAFRAR